MKTITTILDDIDKIINEEFTEIERLSKGFSRKVKRFKQRTINEILDLPKVNLVYHTQLRDYNKIVINPIVPKDKKKSEQKTLVEV